MIEIRKYEKKDKNEAMAIWNAVVREGIAFPQDEELTEETADAFFMSQSYTGIAVDSEANEIVGLYDPAILVSSVNMLLRDEEFDTLESLCYAFSREPKEIKDYLMKYGFVWSEQQKQFRPIGYDERLEEML